MRTKLKVCCISSVSEARLAIDYGASALGLVSEMPSGPGIISEEEIIQIAKNIPPEVSTFLLTSRQDTSEIIQQQKICRVNTIQICDKLTNGSYQDLRDAMPGISLVQVIHVVGRESIDEAISISSDVDAILLDSGNQNLKVKKLGGTGCTHDWSISREIKDSINIPLFLAGGLNPMNVRKAVEIVKPYGVDICSGIRTGGKLDTGLLALFTQHLWNQ